MDSAAPTAEEIARAEAVCLRAGAGNVKLRESTQIAGFGFDWNIPGFGVLRGPNNFNRQRALVDACTALLAKGFCA